jgi:hypothetical protein
LLIHREKIIDSLQSETMARDEQCIWDEMHYLHIDIFKAERTIDFTNHIYTRELYRRMDDTERRAVALITNYEVPLRERIIQLHSYRRLLGIVHQETELVLMDDAQSLTIGEDGAFIALGRR